MGAAVRFKQVSVPRQQGEQARLKVVQGPDSGAVFVITGTQATLGRGEESDIVVSDLKASRRHAELRLVQGGWTVKDLGSANGLLHNSRSTREAQLKNGDSLTFGETTFEFVAGDAATMMLVAPPRSSQEINAANSIFEDQRKKVRSPQGNSSGSKGRLVLFGIIGVVAIILYLMPGDSSRSKPSKKKSETPDDLRKYLPGSPPDPVTARMVEQFFKTGFREYMARNYLRAKAQFETVLQMSPGHPLATLYLENCERDIKAEFENHLIRGKRSMEAGKFKEAKGHFEAVLRILFREQTHPAFIEATEQLEKLETQTSKGGSL
ncbi:FHA domain-containing protein [Bdellovibrionota bacterium FG-1]